MVDMRVAVRNCIILYVIVVIRITVQVQYMVTSIGWRVIIMNITT